MNPFFSVNIFFINIFYHKSRGLGKITLCGAILLYIYSQMKITNFRLCLKAKISIFSVHLPSPKYIFRRQKYVQSENDDRKWCGFDDNICIKLLPHSPIIHLSPELKTMSANLDMKFNYIRFRRGSTLKYIYTLPKLYIVFTYILFIRCWLCVYIKIHEHHKVISCYEIIGRILRTILYNTEMNNDYNIKWKMRRIIYFKE